MGAAEPTNKYKPGLSLVEFYFQSGDIKHSPRPYAHFFLTVMLYRSVSSLKLADVFA